VRAEDIALVTAACRTRAGLKVAPEKTYLIENRLAPVARREGFEGVADLFDAIRASRKEPLVWAVVEAMAAGETAFFRDRAVFELLGEELLPSLAASRGGQGVRIWSAAAATGQEVYSIAMVADELRARDPDLRVELAASDLSGRAISRGQAGLYDQFEAQRGLPVRRLMGFFEKSGDGWCVADRLRKPVRWRRINLIAGVSAIGRFDIVFCRYVLGTMTEEAQRRVLEDLTAVVPLDGYLVLGLGEEVAGLAETFEPVAARPGVFRRNPSFTAKAAA
jgi:chemotaxis protein methyltransferase CheR